MNIWSRRPLPQQVASEIDAALDAGEFARASALAASALASGYAHPMLFHLRAVAAKREGRLEAALADLEQARALAPQSPDVMIETAECLNLLGDYARAVTLAAAAIAADPRRALAWQQKAWAHQSLAELDDAYACFMVVVQLDPSNAFAYASLAQIAAGQSRLSEARRHARRALDREPNNVTALLVLATVERAAGRLDLARARLQAVLSDTSALVPLQAMARSELAEICDAEGRAAEAFENYRGAKASWKDFYGPHILKPGVESIPAQLARLASGLHALPPGPW
jgi:tetratricopeptide (TPR) repeat protein